MIPPSGSGTPAVSAGHGQGGAARPDGVVIERPERSRAARMRRRRGPPRSASDPSAAGPSPHPRATHRRGAPACRTASMASPSSSGRGIGEVDVLRGDRGIDVVEVRVGQARDRDLAGLELDPERVRVGPGLEVHGAAGKGDSAAPDPDRLGPAEAVHRPRTSRSGP